MHEVVRYIIGPLLCYFIGAIPFGYILVRVVKRADIRKKGSGSIGATNAARVLGRWAFFVVFGLDFLKGLVAVLVIFNLFNNPYVFNNLHEFFEYEWTWKNLQVVYGLAAILGHLFPVYLGFRGGKGIATSTGVFIYLTTWAVLAALVVWLVVFLLTRYISVGSILSAIAYSGCYFLSKLVVWPKNPFDPQTILLTIIAVLVAVGVIAMHHTNIGRLLKGREPKSA